MFSLMIGIFAFIMWPLYDIKRTQNIKGIGKSQDERFDDETVNRWKAGRVRAKYIWMAAGVIILLGMALNYAMGFYFPVTADGVYEDPEGAALVSTIVLAFVAVGAVVFAGGLVLSAMNNKKHLGQLHVSVR